MFLNSFIINAEIDNMYHIENGLTFNVTIYNIQWFLYSIVNVAIDNTHRIENGLNYGVSNLQHQFQERTEKDANWIENGLVVN